MNLDYKINHESITSASIYCETILDEDGSPINCKMLNANQAYENLMGVKKEDIIGKTITQVYKSDAGSVGKLIQIIGNAALTGKTQEIEFFSIILNKWIHALVVSHGELKCSVFINITESKNDLESELKKSNYINLLLLDSIPHPAFLVRKDRTVIAANRIAQEQGTLVGGFCWRDWGKSLYINEKDAKRAASYTPGKSDIIRCFFCRGCESLDIEDVTNVKVKLGDIYWDIFWVPTREEGVYLHYAIDITEAKQREKEIKHLSFHDSLTDLYNRAYFEEKLKRIDELHDVPLSIIIGDINGLKMTNDVFGHSKGDLLLKKVAGVLKDSCRGTDIVARYGGDEFAIILPETSYDVAIDICKRINNSCYDKCKDIIPTSISLGCATKETGEESIYKVFKSAEDMMYRYKFFESKTIRNSILSSLERSLHEKDIETKEHTYRLIKYTEKLGCALGLTQFEMDDLELLARYHDIGKITTNEDILRKKEPLTEEEYSAIKKHSEAGYRIAQSSQDMHHIAEYILAHHERWDGKGYPHGLKGKEIPLLSRVFAIVDAYDAMTNERPYRNAMSKAEAIGELLCCSGEQFDPKLVPLFVSVIENE